MAKYYGVKQGHQPGVYASWVECEAQVKGYKGAQYKSFGSEEDAKIYVFGAEQTNANGLSAEDKENIKWELQGIREGLKERDIAFVLDKVNTIAEILKIKLDSEDLSDYKKQ